MSPRALLAVAATLLAFALAVCLAWPAGRRDRWPEPPAPGPGVRAPARGGGVVGELPPSLAGTEAAGALAVDAAGHFVPGREALELFDWVLAATGEWPEADLRARLVAEIEARLDAPADAEATAFLDRYLAYRAGARALAEAGLGGADLERRLQAVRELRRAHFGPVLAERLFGAEEAAIRVDLERARVAADPALTEAERAAELAALDAALPEAERLARREPRAHLALRAEEAGLRAAGAGDAEIQALRAARHGEEAAARLAALDAERGAWDARVAAYRAERARLRAGAADEAAYVAALGALRARSFEGPELLRIEALDRLEQAERTSATTEPR